MNGRLAVLAAFVIVAAAACAGSPNAGVSASSTDSRVALDVSRTTAAAAAPAAPTALKVCGRASLLDGPGTRPAGARVVTTAQHLISVVDNARAGTTFWLTPGVHSPGGGQYDQIVPKTGDTFIGAPGAIIDGGHRNLYAFAQHASHVTISYLTIRGFGKAGDNQDEGVVNHDSADYWHVTHDTIVGNAGAGVMLGSHNVLRDDCLANNGQYGFNAYSASGPVGLTLTHNEISGNDTYNWEKHDPGCGCTGGGKFWAVRGATVTDNYVHSNIGVGLWADTNNRGFDIEGNYISGNDDEGLIYEISYNALIKNNTFVRNALVEGPTNPGFPSSAIYISESGSDPRVPGRFNKQFSITGNRFVDNWSGVVLWENADRFCNSPNNSSSGTCTLVNRPKVTIHTCVAGNIKSAPYYSDCRWKTQRVVVSGNTFRFSPADIGKRCTKANTCGFNGIFSNYGSSPSWSPYQGPVVERAITFNQHNVFANNTYVGPWWFMAHDQGIELSLARWKAAPYHQDKGSRHLS